MRLKTEAAKLAAVCCALWMIVTGTDARAGVIRHDRLDRDYLNLGAHPAFNSVGSFIGSNTSAQTFRASGVLIAPGWVLTAGHVVDLAASLSFTVGGSTYAARGWTPYPLWSGDVWAGYDIGLVQLSKSVLNVTPATRYAGASEKGVQAISVGFGTTGNGLTGATTYDGRKRAGYNVVDAVVSNRLLLGDFDNPVRYGDNSMGSSTPLNLEYMIAPGDSGGGLFGVTTLGQAVLIGIHSFAFALDLNANSDYGDVFGQTRVAAFNSWIDSVMRTNLTPSSRFTTINGKVIFDVIPEPGAAAVWGLAVAVAMLRRRSGRQ